MYRVSAERWSYSSYVCRPFLLVYLSLSCDLFAPLTVSPFSFPYLYSPPFPFRLPALLLPTFPFLVGCLLEGSLFPCTALRYTTSRARTHAQWCDPILSSLIFDVTRHAAATIRSVRIVAMYFPCTSLRWLLCLAVASVSTPFFHKLSRVSHHPIHELCTRVVCGSCAATSVRARVGIPQQGHPMGWHKFHSFDTTAACLLVLM